MRWRSRSDLATLAGLMLLGVAVPLVVAALSGSLAIPHNDDWAYRRDALNFYTHGHFHFVGWGAMTLVGQLLWVWPFQATVRGPVAFALSTIVLAAVGVAAAYLLARRVLDQRDATLATLTLLISAGYLPSTTQFMTDVPMAAASLLCLWLGVLALDRRGAGYWGLLVSSVLIGFWAVAIREFALAAPVAVLAIHGLRRGRRWRSAALTAGFLLAVVVLIGWARSIPGSESAHLSAPTLGSEALVVPMWFSASLPALPALVSLRVRRVAGRWSSALAAALLTVGLSELAFATHGSLLVGNLLGPDGATGNAVLPGLRPALFPRGVWDAIGVAAVVAGFLALERVIDLLSAAVARARRRGAGAVLADFPALGLVTCFAVLEGVGLTGFALVSGIFDRYLWLVSFAGAVVLLGLTEAWQPQPGTQVDRRRAARGLGLAAPAVATGLVVVALCVLLNTDAYDAARWQAGRELVARGVPATEIDAGFEWVGFHQHGPAVVGRPAAPNTSWYVAMFPRAISCAYVAASPLARPGARLVAERPYRLLLLLDPEHLYLYRLRPCAR